MKLILGALLCCAILSGCQRAPAPPPFDVPALIGQPVQLLSEKLGAPAQSSERTKSWTRDGATLTATFKPGNGRVLALELQSRAPENAVREAQQNQLLEPGRLKADDPRYSLDWIEAPERPLFYTGVRVVPAPKNYAVEVRVSGPATEMLQVSYALGAQTESFSTIAPWNQTATLPDDARVFVQARLAQGQLPAGTPITVEILVDGRVVSSATKSVVATCSYEL